MSKGAGGGGRPGRTGGGGGGNPEESLYNEWRTNDRPMTELVQTSTNLWREAKSLEKSGDMKGAAAMREKMKIVDRVVERIGNENKEMSRFARETRSKTYKAPTLAELHAAGFKWATQKDANYL